MTVPGRRTVLFAVALAALCFAGVAGAANSMSFADPNGDSFGAPDIVGVSVTSDDAGTITVKINVPNRPTILAPDDQVEFTLDVDQNPDTGSVVYGSELAIALVGFSLEVFRPGPSGYLSEQSPAPPSLRAVFTGGVATFTFSAADVGIPPGGGFNISAQTFSNVGVDMAPEIRTVNYQLVPGTPPPTLGPDTRAPVDTALPARGKRGKVVHLDYLTADGRGETADTIRVFHGRKVVKTFAYPLNDNSPFLAYYAPWRVPKKARGSYHFCVRSVDRAGNRSNVDCAKIKILK